MCPCCDFSNGLSLAELPLVTSLVSSVCSAFLNNGEFLVWEGAVHITLKVGLGFVFDGGSRCGAVTLCCQESKVRLRPPKLSCWFVLIQEIQQASFLFLQVRET